MRRRLKCYLIFHGDRLSRRLPHSIRVKCPRDGSWDEGPQFTVLQSLGNCQVISSFHYRLGPKLLKETFIKRYGEIHPRTPLQADFTYLVDKFGSVLSDDDKLSLYVQQDGVLHVILGEHKCKGRPNAVIQWGYNSLQPQNILMPGAISSLARERVISIDCGWLHSAVALECGTVLAWGSNEYGQLGTGCETSSPKPVFCKMDRDVRLCKVICGSYFTLAVNDHSQVWSWGRYQASNWPTKFTETWANGYEKRGEVGIKYENIMQLAAGEAHVACITEKGRLFTWGYNEQWQLGWGQDERHHQGQQKPREVRILESSLDPIVDIGCGGLHTAIALKSGKVFAWGSNNEGQIGQVLRKCFSEPQELNSMEHETCATISCGRYSTLCTTRKLCAYFWGSLAGSNQQGTGRSVLNSDGQDTEDDTLAAKRSGLAASQMLSGVSKQLVGTDVCFASIGEAHGILVLHNGELRGWGYNAYGQALGRMSNIDIVEEPRPCNLGGEHSGQVLKICTSGGTSSALVSGVADGDSPQG